MWGTFTVRLPWSKPRDGARKAKTKVAAGVAPWLALGTLIALWPRGAGRRAMDERTIQKREPGRGRDARSPFEIPLRGWRDILWRTWTEFHRDRITTEAAGVTYFALLSAFPALAAFVALYGLFADVHTAMKHIMLLAGVIPEASLKFVGDQMILLSERKNSGLGLAFVVAFMVSIWSANAAVKALFQGLNVAYDEEEKRGFLRLNLVSLAFTVGGVAFMLVATALVVGGPAVLHLLGVHAATLTLLRWPALLAGATFGLSVVYRFGPSREHARWRWVRLGGVVAACLWLAASMGFSWYLANLGHLDRTYGSFGAIAGVMIWMWMSAVIVLFGAELDAEMEHQTAVDTTTGPPLPIGERGAVVADSVGDARP